VAPLFTLVPEIDSVVTTQTTRAGARETVDAVRHGSFDTALLLPNSFNAALLAWRAEIPERWGYRTDWRGPLLTRAVVRPARGHQAEYYQRLVAELGFDSGPLCPRLTVGPAAVENARQLLVNAGWDGTSPLVAFATGAAYGGAKKWPAASFAAVATALIGDGAAIVLVGSEGDRTDADRVKALATGNLVDLVGCTDVPALAAVLSVCRALVTNDSGAMHVAAALAVPVIAMFGPTNERETRPLGPVDATVITSDVWCRPCMLRECPLDHRCMEQIGVATVVAAARARL
jgi:heptosyltransferase-2